MTEISPAAERFLSVMTDQKTVEILELLSLYERMPNEARHFLERADPKTLNWLAGARPAEIDQLQDGIELVRATRTVGKFTRWAIISFVGVFGSAFFAGEHIVKIFNWFRAGGH